MTVSIHPLAQLSSTTSSSSFSSSSLPPSSMSTIITTTASDTTTTTTTTHHQGVPTSTSDLPPSHHTHTPTTTNHHNNNNTNIHNNTHTHTNNNSNHNNNTNTNNNDITTNTTSNTTNDQENYRPSYHQQRAYSVTAMPSDLQKTVLRHQQKQQEQQQRLMQDQPWWQYYYQRYHYHPPPGRKPTVFGPYLLLQTLGEGEFGKVKLGIHIETGHEVAIKLMKRDNIDSSTRMTKVEREISVLRTVRHPYIVKLYDVIETEKYIGIILQCASGGELFEYILAHRYLKEKDASRLFAQLISGVHYMHQKHIVHRDLKLENLLLDRHRNIIITDFGFANQFSSARDDLMSTSCGSPCYAAPELVISEGLYVGSAVDIWSCGVILYAMLCGYLPFDDDPANPDGDNINLLYKYILNTPLQFPDYVSADARDLLRRMLVPDPAKRCSMDIIMQHPWLYPHRHLFSKSVHELELEAMRSSDLPIHMVISHHQQQQKQQKQLQQLQLQQQQQEKEREQQQEANRRNTIATEYTLDQHRHHHQQQRQEQQQEEEEGYQGKEEKQKEEKGDDDDDEDNDQVVPTFEVSRESSQMDIDEIPADSEHSLTEQQQQEEEEKEKENEQQQEPMQDIISFELPAATAAPAATKNLTSTANGNDDIDETSEATQPETMAAAATMESAVILPDTITPTTTSTIITATTSTASSSDTTAGANSHPETKSSEQDVQAAVEQTSIKENPSLASIPIITTTSTSSSSLINNSKQEEEQEKKKEEERLEKEEAASVVPELPQPSPSPSKRQSTSTDRLLHFLTSSGSPKVARHASTNSSSTSSSSQRRPMSLLGDASTGSILQAKFLSSIQRQQQQQKKQQAEKEASSSPCPSASLSASHVPAPSSSPISILRTASPSRDRTPQPGASQPIRGTRRKALSLLVNSMTDYIGHDDQRHQKKPTSMTASTTSSNRKQRQQQQQQQQQQEVDMKRSSMNSSDDPSPNASSMPLLPSVSEHTIALANKEKHRSAGKKLMDWFKKKPLSTKDGSGGNGNMSTNHHHHQQQNKLLSKLPLGSYAVDFNDAKLRNHHGAVDQDALTARPPQEVLLQIKHTLTVTMGMEIKRDGGDYKLKCIRKKRQFGLPVTTSSVTNTNANTKTTNGTTSFSSSSTSSSPTTAHATLKEPSQSSPQPPQQQQQQTLQRPTSSSINASTSSVPFRRMLMRNKSSEQNQPPQQEATPPPSSSTSSSLTYGDPALDPGDEVRFSVEICKIKNLPGLYIVDIKRLRGNLWSYKFLYHALLEQLNLSGNGGYISNQPPSQQQQQQQQ